MLTLAEMMIAPDPADIAKMFALFVLLPLVGIVGAYRLRRRRAWCATWIVVFVGFFAFLFFDGNPTTSRRSADVTFVVQDPRGIPVPHAACTVTQYAVGDDHLTFRAPRDTSLVTSADGRVTVVTTSDRKITATFRMPGYRYVSVELDRAWKPTFQEGQFEYRWSTLAKNEKIYRGDTGWIRAMFPREKPLSIPIILPAKEDDDFLVESRLISLLPKGAARVP